MSAARLLNIDMTNLSYLTLPEVQDFQAQMTDEHHLVSNTFSDCNFMYICLSPVLESLRPFWNALGWMYHGLPLSFL